MIFSVATMAGGQCMGFPDVCKTPSPGGPIPIPYPNIAMLNQTNGGTCASKLKIQNQKVLIKTSMITMSSGDEAGSIGGVISNMIKGPAKPKTASSKLKADGKGVVYQTCMFGQNGNNANVPAGILTMCTQMKVKVMG
ncbi:MAG: PAAR-like domain-containing protein [Myxococcota bacterium]